MGDHDYFSGDPEWKTAFAGIERDAGVAGFLDRTQKHFDLCQSPYNADGSVSPYQHPSRTMSSGTEKDPDAMVALMQRYLNTVAGALQEDYAEEAEVVRKLKVVWTDDWDSVDDDGYARDGAPANISLDETMSEIEDGCEKKNTPKIMSEISEACYGLAASYDLQRYLWVHGCACYFDKTTCYVFDEKGWRATKKIN